LANAVQAVLGYDDPVADAANAPTAAQINTLIAGQTVGGSTLGTNTVSADALAAVRAAIDSANSDGTPIASQQELANLVKAAVDGYNINNAELGNLVDAANDAGTALADAQTAFNDAEQALADAVADLGTPATPEQLEAVEDAQAALTQAASDLQDAADAAQTAVDAANEAAAAANETALDFAALTNAISAATSDAVGAANQTDASEQATDAKVDALVQAANDAGADLADAQITFNNAEQALADAENTALLVKARRIAVAASSHTVTPSCLQGCVARGQPLPVVGLVPVVGGQNEEEEDRKLRTTLAFMCGLGRKAMPRDVFRVVVDLLMPSWDPLRRKDAGAGQPLPQG
jgi:hypothetical protein